MARSRARTLAAALDPRSGIEHLMLTAALVFNFWTLRAERLPAMNLNDGPVHVAMIRWAADRWAVGQIPLDGWFSNVTFGFPKFHHYQSLPHILSGIPATLIGAEQTYSWTLYLLLATWPISAYLGCRLLGWNRLQAACAALISPLVFSIPGYGHETGSYVWRGLGVWSQLWGVWLLPLAWGFSWQAIARRRYLLPAALTLALTVACHFLTGYVALLSVGVMLVVKPTVWRKRLSNALVVSAGAILIGAWVIVPLLQDRAWATRSIHSTDILASHGAPQVLRWLFTGQLFDGNRGFPAISLLVAAGTVVCIAHLRRDERGRVLLGLGLLSLVLFFGSGTLGPLTRLLPGGEDLIYRRFILGVHVSGILIAGVGAAALLRTATRYIQEAWARLPARSAQPIGAALLLLFLLPPIVERAEFAALGGRWIREQLHYDSTDGADFFSLVEQSKEFGPGRIYAGSWWGDSFGDDDRIGRVPTFAALLRAGTDSVGFFQRSQALSRDVEVMFDDTNRAHYDLFYIRYVILPEELEPPVDATLLASAGRHRLWGVSTAGYISCVDTIDPPITASKTELAQAVQPYVESDLPAKRIHQRIDFAGAVVAPSTLSSGLRAPSSPCTVEEQNVDLRNGRASAKIDAPRDGALLLRSSFHGRWKVTVDGEVKTPELLTPSFIGVSFGPGTHQISFIYEPVHYLGTFVLAILGIAALMFTGRHLKKHSDFTVD